jgi:hypothetical protein
MRALAYKLVGVVPRNLPPPPTKDTANEPERDAVSNTNGNASASANAEASSSSLSTSASALRRSSRTHTRTKPTRSSVGSGTSSTKPNLPPKQGIVDVSLSPSELLYARIWEKGWGESEEGQAFYKLLLLNSFIPNPHLDSYSHSPGATSESSKGKGKGKAKANPPASTGSARQKYTLRPSTARIAKDLSPAVQRYRAVNVARTKVYNLGYLRVERCWGPFLPLTKPSTLTGDGIGGGANKGERSGSSQSLGAFHQLLAAAPYLPSRELQILLTHVLEEYGDYGDESGDDEEYVPPGDGSSSAAVEWEDVEAEDEEGQEGVHAHSHTADGIVVHFTIKGAASDSDVPSNDDDGDDHDADSHHHHHHVHVHSHFFDDDDSPPEDDDDEEEEEPSPTFVHPPYPHLLQPDWEFLSAVRLVIESNLRTRVKEGGDLTAVPFRVASRVADAGKDEEEEDDDVEVTEDGVVVGGDDEAIKLARRTLRALQNLELTRMGSSPNFWCRGWVRKDYVLDEEGNPLVSQHDSDGRGRPQLKARPESSSSFPSNAATAGLGVNRGVGDVDQEGFWKRDWEEWYQGGEMCWDWAGVEGEWMRCVCWMDYRGLLCECFFSWSVRVYKSFWVFLQSTFFRFIYSFFLFGRGFDRPSPPVFRFVSASVLFMTIPCAVVPQYGDFAR